MPGPAAMLTAILASTVGKSAEPLRLRSIVRHRLVPTGCISDHFGPESQRLTGDAVLSKPGSLSSGGEVGIKLHSRQSRTQPGPKQHMMSRSANAPA